MQGMLGHFRFPTGPTDGEAALPGTREPPLGQFSLLPSHSSSNVLLSRPHIYLGGPSGQSLFVKEEGHLGPAVREGLSKGGAPGGGVLPHEMLTGLQAYPWKVSSGLSPPWASLSCWQSLHLEQDGACSLQEAGKWLLPRGIPDPRL